MCAGPEPVPRALLGAAQAEHRGPVRAAGRGRGCPEGPKQPYCVSSQPASQVITYRPVSGDVEFKDDDSIEGGRTLDPETSSLVLSENFVSTKDTRAAAILHLSGGVLVSISKRLVFRSGFLVNPIALDAPLAKSIVVGLGLRL